MKRWNLVGCVVMALLWTSCATLSQLEAKRIDINTASRAQLETLPGIGPATAQRIIESRPYYNVKGLLNVKGIDMQRLKAIEHCRRVATPNQPYKIGGMEEHK